MSYLVVPSALIHATGFGRLTLSELRLFWRLVGELGKDNSEADGEATLSFLVSELVEPGDGKAGRERLEVRLESLMEILLKANLDGRDGAEYWRAKLRFISAASIRDDQVEISIPGSMTKAIRSRATFTKIRESVLFSMRGSKYSAILYTLIMDKNNQRVKRWQVDIAGFRTVMQVPEKAYANFKNFRVNVIEAAIKELNEVSEFNITWEKARTFKNEVRELAFEWHLKDLPDARKTVKEQQRHSAARGKVQESADAPPLIVLDRAARWLDSASPDERRHWAARAVQLGAPETPAMMARENIHKWVNWVARELLADGNISAT